MPTVKLIAWNLFLGGIDARHPLSNVEDRRLGQLEFLASTDADVYWLTEAKDWHTENGRRMLLESGWRDPQAEVARERAATTGYWWPNEQVPMRIDQVLLAGPRIKTRDYLTHDSGDLRRLSDHLPMELTIEL